MQDSGAKKELISHSESTGRRIRRRLLIGFVLVAVVCAGAWAALSAWIRPPHLPEIAPAQREEADGLTQAGGAGEKLEDEDLKVPQAAQSGQREGVYTFLIVGQDTGGGGLTDTMLLVTYDTASNRVYGMHLPRDTMINVKTASKKLNAVYNYHKGTDKSTQVEKGMAALKNEVAKLTGIVPNFYILIQWEAVGELVDALGGVWFEVPYNMNYDDPYQNLHIHQQAGYRRLTGEDAMQVIRHRMNNDGSHSRGDLGRLAVQQDFLKALARQCLQPATLLKAPALIQVFMNNVSTDLETGNLLYFARMASGMDAENDVVLTIMPWADARYPGVSMILPIRSELLETLNNGFNPYADEIRASDLQILYRNADGSYGVTSGTLADPSLASPRSAAQKPKPAATQEGPSDTNGPGAAESQEDLEPRSDLTEQDGETQGDRETDREPPGEIEGEVLPGELEDGLQAPDSSDEEESPTEPVNAAPERAEDMEGVPEWMLPQ